MMVADCIKHFFPMLIGKTIDEMKKHWGCGLSLLITVSYGGWVLKKELSHSIAAIFNSLWDLVLKNQKPLWKFIVDSEPETIMK